MDIIHTYKLTIYNTIRAYAFGIPNLCCSGRSQLTPLPKRLGLDWLVTGMMGQTGLGPMEEWDGRKVWGKGITIMYILFNNNNNTSTYGVWMYMYVCTYVPKAIMYV